MYSKESLTNWEGTAIEQLLSRDPENRGIRERMMKMKETAIKKSGIRPSAGRCTRPGHGIPEPRYRETTFTHIGPLAGTPGRDPWQGTAIERL